MKQHNTVPLNQRGGLRQPSRQDPARQIASLKALIQDNLKRAGTLANRGSLDNALRCADVALAAKARLIEVVKAYEAANRLPIMPDATQSPRKPSTSTIVKRKTYKRFSKK